MATYKNYSISASKGKLYLKEKAPKEGYVEVTYGTEGNKKTYHKYEDSIQGIVKSFETREAQHEGRTLRFLEFTLQDGDTFNKVSVPLKNKNGHTDEVRTIVSAFDGYKIGERVTLTPKSKTYTPKNGGAPKEQLAIYLNYVDILGENGKGLSTGYIPFNEIPRAEKEVDEDDGEVTWNWKPVNKFYSQKIKEISERFPKDSSPAPSTAPEAKPTTTAPSTSTVIEDDEDPDDLPF